MNIVSSVNGVSWRDVDLDRGSALRSVGGIRLSLYNAVTEDQVDGLVAFIREFIDSSPGATKT